MKNVMVGIPVIYCEECVKLCLESLREQDSHVFIVDNDSTSEIKKMIESYPKLVNDRNLYVNPAWNQIMKYFLDSNYEKLIILNSDMILNNDVIEKISAINIDEDLSIVLPNVSDHDMNEGSLEIEWGYPGIMIVLTQKMAKLVYPIPESLKIWFGDDWIYRRLIKNGYKLRIYYDIKAHHSGSRSIVSLKEASEIIEQDKLNWIVEEKKI